MITADALGEVMGRTVPAARYEALLPAYRDALTTAGCLTVNRAAMFAAQLGHESAGLRYMEEIASGAAYNGRRDLGNTEPGDGPRFKGRGPLQITGRSNYRTLSAWAHSKGLVPSATYFVDRPTELASDRYGFLGASWYWTVARPQINAMCDAADLVGVTRAINGGTNGLADRRNRWDLARRMAERITPGVPAGGMTAQPAPVSSRPTVRQGAKGPDVRDLQSRLNRDYPRYSNLTVDGDFGPATDRVVREFQRRAGLSADGVVGPITWKALHL